MTREEAVRKAQIIDFQGGYTIGLVMEIYNDFEKLSGSKQLVDNHKSCENCKWCAVLSSNCDWCERHPSRQIRNINIKDYWESKE